jgi:hypothetical protein
MSESKVKSSSFILNLILIVLGLLFVFMAVLNFLIVAGLVELPEFLEGLNPEQASFFGSLGFISIALGFWSIVAGIGMFKEEEWAMGQALVVLSIMVISNISPIINWITNPSVFDIDFWMNYITIIAFVVGIIGFIWLLVTRKRYD